MEKLRLSYSAMKMKISSIIFETYLTLLSKTEYVGIFWGHFLLQCMKVKSESEVAQLCLTLSDPRDCSLPGFSIHGNMPTNSENSAVATGQEKVSLHSNPKESQCQRMFKLSHNCTHLTC